MDLEQKTAHKKKFGLGKRILTSILGATMAVVPLTSCRVVSPYENNAPVIETETEIELNEKEELNSVVIITDADGDKINYELISNPGWLEVKVEKEENGLVELTIHGTVPEVEEDTDYHCFIRASDLEDSRKKRIKIKVKNVPEEPEPEPENHAPVFNITPGLITNENTEYIGDYNATDEDGDFITYTLSLPEWLSNNPEMKRILGASPSVDEDTNFLVSITASDGKEETVWEDFLSVKDFIVDVANWTENATPVFDPAAKAYYPSVVKVADGDYRMWYGSDSGIGYATSLEGLIWNEEQNPVIGLTSANHPHVELVNGVYKIWYQNESQLYSMNAIRYAESTDGITWTGDQATTGNLVTGAGTGWNRGSYGATEIIYNPDATNAGANPFDYSYVMYFDGTDGGTEEIGLGYSPDGKDWELYGKVLPRGNNGAWGNTDDWDSSYSTFGAVIKDAENRWYMFYSGGQIDSNDGIGAAYSSDGLNWTREDSNPVMHYTDGVSYRNNRTYTPSVMKDGNAYKMWFSGKDSATGNYAIGYAVADEE
ncbi:MAG: putative Ig domain-containing protein [Candidatus Nanoarchaeia archaeon]|nr:putative Ig domain-containing protein [Candidatus Nanoarchaeia archaeon]